MKADHQVVHVRPAVVHSLPPKRVDDAFAVQRHPLVAPAFHPHLIADAHLAMRVAIGRLTDEPVHRWGGPPRTDPRPEGRARPPTGHPASGQRSTSRFADPAVQPRCDRRTFTPSHLDAVWYRPADSRHARRGREASKFRTVPVRRVPRGGENDAALRLPTVRCDDPSLYRGQ